MVVVVPLPRRGVRRRLVRLGALGGAFLSRRDVDPAVARLAGQALALTAGLAFTLKFQGSFSLQAKSDGPVSLLLADSADGGAPRGYAHVDPTRLASLLAESSAPTAAQLLRHGYLAFTVDQGPGAERHQGIVAIEGTSMTDLVLLYFAISEQIRYWVYLACASSRVGWQAVALLLEKEPG